MDMNAAMTWAGTRTDAVLITLRRDGRAQSSDIAYALNDGVFAISVTADRAKTINMARDPRVVLHLTDRGSWSYLAFDGTAELMDPTTDPTDATADALVAYYEAVAGAPHPNWDEYRSAMVAEGRLLALVTPLSVVGQLN